MSSHLKAELAATCSTLGRLHKGEYLIEPECIESVKDLIRYLKRDNEAHEIRRYLGESKVLQNDLVHIIKSCPEENPDLFDVTIRLLVNLTTPTMLFYGEEIPVEKIGRNIYLTLIGHCQDYKIAFCDVELWNKICGKLTDMFEIDWSERSADDGIKIERILMLLRNVLQVPADVESEKRPENDISVHDKVLWALRQSQILELLLFISSNENEEQYYLNLLEIFSLILREQNPKKLAHCDIQYSASEKTQEMEDLNRVRELEKKNRNKYVNVRNFNTTFVMKGVKSLSDSDVVCHKSLEKVNQMDLNNFEKKQMKAHKNRIPVESGRVERRSTFSVRLFLKEFCLEFLNCSFNHLMHVVKSKLDSGKSLANDQTYYFWALNFFLEFATASNSDVDLIKDFLSSESFYFVLMSMDNALEHLIQDKKKTVDWVKRIHLILIAYRSLLETLLWMDHSKNPLTRSVSREIKSKIFYVVEYREMTLRILIMFDPTKFSASYLRDLIETIHLFIKLLEEYSKQTKLVVQKITRKKSSKKKSKKIKQKAETREEKWEKIKDDVYDSLCCESSFPEIPPFDAALEIPVDDQKGRAMKNIQKFLHDGKIVEGIGLLRSARQVWPENDCFGAERLSVEDETMALQEICLADLGEVEVGDIEKSAMSTEEDDVEGNEELEGENQVQIVEQDFDIMDYKKRLVNKKVIEACGILLRNYKKNSDHTNHCAIKLLHRIGWECCMPAMLFQASIFWTLLKIMKDDTRNYEEINTFTVNLMRKFRKHASENPTVFLELLFWKDHNVALEIQHGYKPYEEQPKAGKVRKKKSKMQLSGDEEEKKKGKRKKSVDILEVNDVEINSNQLYENQTIMESSKKKKRIRKKRTKEIKKHNENEIPARLKEDEDDAESSALKNVDNVSRVLFDDNFESDQSEDEVIILNKTYNRKNTSANNKERDAENQEEHQSNRVEINSKLYESNEKENQQNISKPAKANPSFKGSRCRIINSSDDDNEEERGNDRLNEKSPQGAREGNIISNNQMKDGQVFPAESHVKTNESLQEKNQVVNIKPLKHYSGREANESRFKRGTKSRKRIIQETQKRDEVAEVKDSDRSSNSQISNASYKKRGREADKKETRQSSEDSNDSDDNSKTKRIRCIDSDSIVDGFESEEEELISAISENRRRRRLAVIDSDSDLETNAFDEKRY